MRGSVEPRIWTPPLRELTPDTSYGFAVIEFAREVLDEPLDPWQEWIAVHAGELLEDGRPRFRQVLILVARQNGKSHLLKVLALYWQFVERWPLIVSSSTNLDYAREAWEKAVQMAESSGLLSPLIPPNGVRRASGEQCLTTTDGCRHKIAASNRKGGRSLSIDRLVLDELREHRSWEAWNAAVPATNARPYAQIYAISNQGDDESVVLNSLRESALGFMSTGDGDPRLGLFEYSAPDGCDLDDENAWAAANPNLGHRLDVDTIVGAAVGTMIASNSMINLKKTLSALGGAFKSKSNIKQMHLDLLCLMFEILQKIKRDGLMSLEGDIEEPEASPLFEKYPLIMKDHHLVDFITDYLRMMLGGSLDVIQIESLMEQELDVHHQETHIPVASVTNVGDGLPAFGIVAAVMGVVHTMGSIGLPPAELGKLIGAALVGTFLGILLAYRDWETQP